MQLFENISISSVQPLSQQTLSARQLKSCDLSGSARPGDSPAEQDFVPAYWNHSDLGYSGRSIESNLHSL
jgi:hypothetical protein